MNHDKEILSFLQGNKVATICGTQANRPYCFNCFYASSGNDMLLVFKSSANSRHAAILKDNPFVAGTVLAYQNSILNNQGLQFEGVVIREPAALKKLAAVYYRRYPFAVTVPGEIFGVALSSIRLTHTSGGVRKKYSWAREPETR
jgi:uncharacterized protein YhbP (UPF0306 family)